MCFWIIADIKAGSALEYRTVDVKLLDVKLQEFFNSCKIHVKVVSVSSSKIAADGPENLKLIWQKSEI
uniref:Uncharacterized protein n=1 Tax=Rhizophagus irregularis (strain DAOM 181602 / DAOM 197198 / MUCL 43194) TaxID=747089 RepID=U9UBC3_RHIID